MHTIGSAGLALHHTGEALVDDVQQVVVLERGGDALLVVELLVDGGLGRVRPRRHVDVDLEAAGQRAQQLHADAQAYQRRHAAVRDGRREVDVDAAAPVVDGDQAALRHAQLLERVRVLRVLDVADEFEDLVRVKGVARVE
eukprot:6590210-Prymnesium_polylepis.1